MTTATEQVGKMANTIREAAFRLGVSIPYLRKEIGLGRLKVARFGRRVLIPEVELARYLNSKMEAN